MYGLKKNGGMFTKESRKEMTVCYIKNREKGLWFRIKCLQDILDSPTASEFDKAKARECIKPFKKLLKDGQNGIV